MRVNEWLIRLEAIGTAIEDIEEKIRGEIIAYAKSERPAPARLKEAFLRILYAYEMRYAENALLHWRRAITDAADIEELEKALLSGIKTMLPGGCSYNYIVVRALRYMSENYSNPDMQLNAVAEYVCVSPAYLSRKLKEETGKSFQSLNMKLRMEAAAKLLRHTGDKVYSVATSVGYANYRSFVNAFINYYGISPQKFR